ncbi:MAG: hypothetical protein UZ14_CFX002001269 [Chloroflexi bacterium OLB14]|nr:MAG: hypothetical protein UZ14_CFX002001269 [Chloroflexi bacterium OLB14]
MLTKPPSTISAVLSVILLIASGLFTGFFLLVALNGFSEREGLPGLLAYLICVIVMVVVGAIFASKLTSRFILKNNWRSFWAVSISLLIVVIIGILYSSGAVLLSVALASFLR